MFPVLGSAQQITYATNTAAFLAQIYLWDPSWGLAQDPEVYEKQSRDLVISGACDVLQRAIVGHDFTWKPKKDDDRGRLHARVMEDLTKEQRGFAQSLYNLSRSAHLGCTWGRLYPERRLLTIGDDKPRWWTVVAKVRDADKRRFRLVQDLGDGEAVSARPYGSPASVPAADGEAKITQRGADAGPFGRFKWQFHAGFLSNARASYYTDLEKIAPFDHWIQHVSDTREWGFGYGYALADELFAYSWMKSQLIRWAMQAAERFGQGFLTITAKALRDGMAKGANQASVLQQTVQAVRTMRAENFIALDEGSTINMVDMPSEGMRWLMEWTKYLDNAMRQRILAALQPTGAGDGDGGYSSAKVEEGSQDDQVAYLRTPLEETWSDTVGRFLVEHNQENLAELGLADCGLSRLQLKGREQRDVEQMLKVFELAWKLKVPVRLEDFYTIFKLSPPNALKQALQWPEPVVQGLGVDGGQSWSEPDGDEAPIGEGGRAVGDKMGAAA